MNTLIKILLMLMAGIVLGFSGSANTTYELIQKNGKATSYLRVNNEFAFTNIQSTGLDTALFKKIKTFPSYTLFSAQRLSIGTDTASTLQNRKSDKGSVYYKNAKKDDAHRYISTGEILVVFDAKDKISLRDFTSEHRLKFIKVISFSKTYTVLFSNLSNTNDIELSSSLIKISHVLTAKPNWILPVTLY